MLSKRCVYSSFHIIQADGENDPRQAQRSWRFTVCLLACHPPCSPSCSLEKKMSTPSFPPLCTPSYWACQYKDPDSPVAADIKLVPSSVGQVVAPSAEGEDQTLLPRASPVPSLSPVHMLVAEILERSENERPQMPQRSASVQPVILNQSQAGLIVDVFFCAIGCCCPCLDGSESFNYRNHSGIGNIVDCAGTSQSPYV